MQKINVKKKDFLSVVLPCRNEEASLGESILKIKRICKENNIRCEIIVSDSSYDSSPQIARKYKVILVKHNKKGYGVACRIGVMKATGNYIFIADPDSTYDFQEIPRFLSHLKKDADFVIGNRFSGKIEKGSMPWSHRHIGNPILSLALKIFFNTTVGDANCGMRAIKRSAYDKLSLKTNGWEFSHEMVVKAKINKLSTLELPISYYARQGNSKLNTIPGGIRQFFFVLKFAYLYGDKLNV